MLSDLELADYDELIDPDAPKEANYTWDQDYQRAILSALMRDRQFLLQSLDLVKPGYFTNKAHQTIAGILFAHFREHRTLPDRVVYRRRIADQVKRDADRTYCHVELESCWLAYEPGVIPREMLSSDISGFARMMSLSRAFNESLAMIRRDNIHEQSTWDKVHSILKDAMTVEAKLDNPHDYFGSVRDRYVDLRKWRDSEEVLTTGFGDFDRRLTFGGMRRGEIYAFVGLPGTGKSLCLVKTACANLAKRRRILYVSLEMSEYDIAARFDAQLADVNIRRLLESEQQVIDRVEDHVRMWEVNQQLLIKQFASGTASVETIRALLSQLEYNGWHPDMLIVDYVGELAGIRGMEKHEYREQQVRELRGIGVEQDMVVVTALQPHRRAQDLVRDGQFLTGDTLADSFGQLRVLDGAYSINQNFTEKRAMVARMYVMKSRSGESGYHIHVKIDDRTLEFCQIPEQVYKMALANASEEEASKVKMDTFCVAKKSDFEPRG